MSGDRWRCFVAVSLDDALRDDLAEAVATWRRRPDVAELRWSEPSGWHLTIAFLGAADPAGVPRLLERLGNAAADHRPMRLTTGGLGGFPSAARARVAWLGVADPDGALGSLARDVRAALELDVGAPFRGHITLARSRRAPVDLRGWVASATDAAPSRSIEVDRLTLMRSHVGGGAARYDPLGSVPLGVPAIV